MKKKFNAWNYDAYSGILDAIKTFKVYVGVLDAHVKDTGAGFIWILREYGKNDRTGQIKLNEGDHLVIYGKGGEVIFDETITPDRDFHQNDDCGNIRVHWTQKGWKPEIWASFFIRPDGETPYRAVLLKKKK